MSSRAPLAGVVVAALGRRIAVGACASLLARMGAIVVFLEQRGLDPQLASFRHGCSGVEWSYDDAEQAAAALHSAHVVLQSSDDGADLPPALLLAAQACAIRCDITALGRPRNGEPCWSDADLQAATGIMDVTGLPGGPACQVGLPIVELSGALYAATSIAVAVRQWRVTGNQQPLTCCLYDVAFNALATFLPAYLGGNAPRRIGNQHPLSAPWDAYLSDTWLLVCTVSDDQWRRLAQLIGGEELADDARFTTLQDRLLARDELNRLVGEWVCSAPVALRERQLLESGTPCGKVVSLAELADEPNLVFRGTILRLPCGKLVPAGLSGAQDWWGGPSSPAPAARVHRIESVQEQRASDLPLTGLRVLEIGQYTTAPLVSRHLGSLGANVLKIEPISGDTARAYLPAQDGTSLFFAMTNNGKTCVRLDLASSAGKACFRELVSHSDVLVENLKPDALAKLGFSPEILMGLNPRLVYAAISGFGASSLHRGRPAYDTVIQAMSGLMDATHSDETPLKAGVSIADIAGGQIGLLNVIGALIERDATGAGRYLDVSMQDACAWLTQPAWNGDWHSTPPVQPVRTVADVCTSPITRERGLLLPVQDSAGRTWHLLGSPLSLAGRRPVLGVPDLEELTPSQACAWWRAPPTPQHHIETSLEHS